MPLRLKKILGALLVVVFMLFWVWLAVSLSGFVPKNKFAEMVFYIVAVMIRPIPNFTLINFIQSTLS